MIGNQDAVAAGVVESVKRIPAKELAYNLLVSPGGTFLANGIVVHNKGCFLPETLVRRADGSEVAIASVQPHDRVLAFTLTGEAVIARVRSVLTHEVDRYKVVTTGSLTVRVTAEHPFYVGNGTFKTLESLKVGDHIFAFDGRGLVAEPIESIAEVRKKVVVYNLQTDAPIHSSPTASWFTTKVAVAVVDSAADSGVVVFTADTTAGADPPAGLTPGAW